MTNIIDTLSADQPTITPDLQRGHVLAAGGNVTKVRELDWEVLSNGKKYTVILDTAWRCACSRGSSFGKPAMIPFEDMNTTAPHFCKHIAAVVITETLGLKLSKPQSIFEMVIGIVANQAIYTSPTDIYNDIKLVQDDDLLRLKKGKVVSEPIAVLVNGRWQMVFDSSVNYEMWVKEIKE